MPHYLASDDRYRDLIWDDDYRSYLMAQSKTPSGYKFGRMQGSRLGVRARSAFGRFNGYMKNMIEAIADAKLRRMQRELELHGVRFDRSSDSWVTGKSTATECDE